MEAFMEAYHVIVTHPQVAVSNGDANSQYDVYGEHVDRFISTLGVLSPHLYGKHTTRRKQTHKSRDQCWMIRHPLQCRIRHESVE